MGNVKPHRHEVVDKQFPVRIRVKVGGGMRDWENEETARWLRQIAGEGNYGITPAVLWSSQRAAHLHLPSLHAASSLVLACPHLRLVGEPCRGPMR
jgi:hypothetical protein